MAQNHSWLPTKRDNILGMAKVWQAIIADKAGDFNIPAEDVTAFNGIITTADKALKIAEQERSPVKIQDCKTAFTILIKKMRFFKSHYFLIPPLTDSDIISLHLTPKDTSRTKVPVPSNQVTAKVRPLGPALLELVMEIIGDTTADPHITDYGYSIYYCIMADGEDIPDSPDKFLHHGFTRRRKEIVNRLDNERGKRIYFCIRLENAKGQQGPWGPVFWTIIP